MPLVCALSAGSFHPIWMSTALVQNQVLPGQFVTVNAMCFELIVSDDGPEPDFFPAVLR